MEWKDVLSKITNAAPIVGSLFGAPGIAAGAIVKLTANALGVAPTQEAIAAEIQQNPEALLKLKELDSVHKTELEKLYLEGERTRLADVSDARKRQTEHEKQTGKSDINLYVLAWVMVVGFFVLMGLLLKIPVPEDQNGVIFMLFGAMSSAFGAVIQYFFGSSKGSADKTTAMVEMTKKPQGK